MKLLYPRCCVLVVQGQKVLACVRIQDAGGPAHDEVQTYAILPAELAMLSDWLAAHGVTHVAIESAKHAEQPIHRALQHNFTLLQIEAGRVTDDKDIGRIASLLAYGLEPCHVVPPTSLEESPPHSRRGLITLGALMVTALLASSLLWTRPGRMYSEFVPVPTLARRVQWQQPSVSYQFSGGQQFTVPLPMLERSPEGTPVEVALDETGDRPDWLHFDREQLSIQGMAPSSAEDQTYRLIIRAQAKQASESLLQVSLTISGQPEPPVSPVLLRW
jgi:hypothetical protein